MKKEKKIVSKCFECLLLFLFIGIVSFGQTVGIIYRADTKEPISFATIEATYKNADKKFFISDSSGYYQIDTVNILKIFVTKMGYTPYAKDFSFPTPSEFNIGLEIFVQTLSTVEVKSAKPLIQGDVNKISYSVYLDSTLKNSSATEAISRLPFLKADAFGNVSYNSKNSFIVFVNGTRFGAFTNDPNTILKSMPASMIKSIEIIFDPPIEYKLKGVDILLNIITLPGYYKGILGSMNTSVNTIGEYQLSPNFSLQHNKSYFQLTYSKSLRNIKRSNNSQYNDYLTGSSIIQKNNFSTESDVDKLNFFFDRKIDSTSRFGLFATVTNSSVEEDPFSNISYKKNSVTEFKTLKSYWENKTFYRDFGADYNKSFGMKKNAISFLIKYSRETITTISSIDTEFFKRNYFNQSPIELSAQLTSNIIVNKKISWETFLKYIDRSSVSITSVDSLLIDKWTSLNGDGSGKYRFKIFNFTSQISFRSKKTSLRLGGTFDIANYNANTDLTIINSTLKRFLPLLNFRVLIAKAQYLSLNYQSSLLRPTFISLAGNIPTFDPLTVRQGNINLGTNINHRITPEFLLYFGKNNTWSAYSNIVYEFSNSYFNTFSTFDSSLNKRIISFRQSRYRNIFYSIGIDAESIKKWTGGFTLKLGYIKLGDYKTTSPVFESNASVLYRLKTNMGVQFLLNYRSKYITSMGFFTGYGSYDMNYYCFLFKRKLQLNILASNFLKRTLGQKEYVISKDFEIINTNSRPFRSFQIVINYRFGNLKTFELKTKRLSNNDQKNID